MSTHCIWMAPVAAGFNPVFKPGPVAWIVQSIRPMDFTGKSIQLVFWAWVKMVVALDVHPSVGMPWANPLPLTNSSVSFLSNTKGKQHPLLQLYSVLWCTSEAQPLLWWAMTQSCLLNMNDQIAFQHYCSILLQKLGNCKFRLQANCTYFGKK